MRSSVEGMKCIEERSAEWIESSPPTRKFALMSFIALDILRAHNEPSATVSACPAHAVELKLESARRGEGVRRVERAQIFEGGGGAEHCARHPSNAPRGAAIVVAADRKLAEGRQQVAQRICMLRGKDVEHAEGRANTKSSVRDATASWDME
eukprot:6211723-Pleurochrysis_carterae.AAC.2